MDNSVDKCSRGKDKSFAVKLFRILSQPSYNDIISWLPHGRSWRILQPNLFEKNIIPFYFRHRNLASFMRQVNGWGFRRVNQGPDRNSYYHESFLRGRMSACRQMRRPSSAELRVLKASSPQEPNFYEMSKNDPLPEESLANVMSKNLLETLTSRQCHSSKMALNDKPHDHSIRYLLNKRNTGHPQPLGCSTRPRLNDIFLHHQALMPIYRSTVNETNNPFAWSPLVDDIGARSSVLEQLSVEAQINELTKLRNTLQRSALVSHREDPTLSFASNRLSHLGSLPHTLFL